MIEKTMKADTMDHPPSDACKVMAANVPGPATDKKKKTKVKRFRMTLEHIGRALSVRVSTRPMPPSPSKRWPAWWTRTLGIASGTNMAKAAAAVYAMREQTRLD